jgi:hypothetical protein
MFPEDDVAALVGCPREDLLPYREGRTQKKGRLVLWTLDGVKALFADLGIPPEKIPAGWDLQAPPPVEARPEYTLDVYRTTGNPGIILCHLEGRVVRCRIRPGTSQDFRPKMQITALREVNDLFRLIKIPRRIS